MSGSDAPEVFLRLSSDFSTADFRELEQQRSPDGLPW
jgi:hypothetical protein